MAREPRGTRAAEAEATKADILTIAREEFADKGLAGARIDEIANRTNTSKRMIYYHFASKEGLYRAVLEGEYSRISETEIALPIDQMSAEEALRANVRLTFDYHHDHPEFVRLVMNENIHYGAYIKGVSGISRRSESVARVLGEIIAKGRAEGVFRDDLDPIDLHMTISALCFYNVSNRYTFSEIFRRDLISDEAASRRREQVADIVVASCRRP